MRLDIVKMVVLLLAVWQTKAQYQPLACFRTRTNGSISEQIILWNGSTTAKTNQVGGYNTTVTWSKKTPNIAYSFLSLMGFKLYPEMGNFLSFGSLLSVNSTQGIITINPINSKILILEFVVSLITSSCNKDIEFVSVQYKCLMLNQVTRNSSLFGTIEEQYAMFNSTKFVFTSSSAFRVRPFISAITVKSVDPTQLQSLYVTFYSLQVSNTNFTIKIHSYSPYKNIIESVSFSVLVISLYTFTPSVLNTYIYNYAFSTSKNVLPNFGIPNNVYSLGYEDKCLISIYFFSRFMNVPSGEVFISRTAGNITDIQIAGIKEVDFYTLCFLQCQPGYSILPNSTNECSVGPFYIKNCISYDAQNRCIQCSTDYKLMSPNLCQQCNGIGKMVTGGCTKDPGCAQVYKVGIDAYPTVCVTCYKPDFYLDGNGICQCYNGWLISENCIRNYGCLTTKKVMGTTICLSCNITGKFRLVGNYCACANGYQLNNEGLCLTICGDGKVLQGEECDDGNNGSDDGCERCKVQKNFRCSGGSDSTPSHCRYVGTQMSIAYLYADKTPQKNQAVFTFSIYPPMNIFLKMNLSLYFNFSSLINHSSPRWVYKNSELQLIVDYSEDLEGSIANFHFSFDNNYFLHKDIDKTVVVRSKGDRLVVSSGGQNLKMMTQFLEYLSMTALILVGVCSLARRMMGVELLQLFQTIYFVHLATADYTDLYSKLKSFGYLSANFYFFFEPNSSFLTGESMGKLPYSSANAEFTLIFLFFALVSLGLILLLTKLLIFCLPYKLFPLKIRKMIVENCLLTLLLGSWLPTTMVVCSLGRSEWQGQWIPQTGLLFMAYVYTVAVSLLVSYEWGGILLMQKECIAPKHFKKTYISVFISFFFIQNLLISLTAMEFETYLAEGIGLLALLTLVWQVKNSPYNKTVHNFGVFLNQFIIAFFCVWSAVRDRLPSLTKEDTETLFLFLILSLIVLSLFVTVMRIIVVFKENYDQIVNVPERNEKKEVTGGKEKVKTLNPVNVGLASYLKESMMAVNPYSILQRANVGKSRKEQNKMDRNIIKSFMKTKFMMKQAEQDETEPNFHKL